MSLLILPAVAGASADVIAVAGEDLAIRDCVYLDPAEGSETPGRAYKVDATETEKSSTSWIMGFVIAGVSSGASVTVRVVGQLSGFSGLDPGSTYFASETAGLITDTEPGNARIVAIALSTTEILINSRGLNTSVGVGGPVKGYVAGGYAASASAVTDKLTFSTDTFAAIVSANLSLARYGVGGLSEGNTKGYFAGGITGGATPVVTGEKLTYSSDVTAALTTVDLSQARDSLASVSECSAKGYFMGGRTDVTYYAQSWKITFATDTTAYTASANISQARAYLRGTSDRATKGYCVGGYTGAHVNTADKITFSGDTTAAQSSANLSAARQNIAGVNGGLDKGYFCGGYTASDYVATTDKITFATDTTATCATADLSTAKDNAAAISEGQTKGYVTGGMTGSNSDTTDEITFSTDTTAAQTTATLSVARRALMGFGDVAS